MLPRRGLTAAFALAAVVATSCGAGSQTAAPAPPQDAPAGPRASPAEEEIPEILRFSATTVDGDRIDGATFLGQKLAVWLWAPW